MPVPLAGPDEVLAASGHDPLALRALDGPLVAAWRDGPAVLWITRANQRATAVGPADAVSTLLVALVQDLPVPLRLSLPRPTLLPTGWVLGRGSEWDFRWTSSPPPLQPRETEIGPVDDDEGVAALLSAANPTASSYPGAPDVRRWVGSRSPDGRLDVVAADTSTARVGHLSSIGTRPCCRGQGLGAAVTAWLTRDLLRAYDVVTLGMYADNAVGRRLYDRLGFHDNHPYKGGWLERV